MWRSRARRPKPPSPPTGNRRAGEPGARPVGASIAAAPRRQSAEGLLTQSLSNVSRIGSRASPHSARACRRLAALIVALQAALIGVLLWSARRPRLPDRRWARRRSGGFELLVTFSPERRSRHRRSSETADATGTRVRERFYRLALPTRRKRGGSQGCDRSTERSESSRQCCRGLRATMRFLLCCWRDSGGASAYAEPTNPRGQVLTCRRANPHTTSQSANSIRKDSQGLPEGQLRDLPNCVSTGSRKCPKARQANGRTAKTSCGLVPKGRAANGPNCKKMRVPARRVREVNGRNCEVRPLQAAPIRG